MSRKRIKQYLMLLTVVGLIAVAANGSGTFASFSAETTNGGNTFATGTLFLHDSANGGTACTSESAGSNLQTSGCDVLLPLALSKSGATRTADLALSNAGSLAATDIKFFSPGGCTPGTPSITTLGAGGATGSPATINVAAIPQPLFTGNTITLTNGSGQTDTLTLTADAAFHATSLSVSGTLGHTYLSGDGVSLVTTFTTPVTICGHVTMTVQETDSSYATPVGACAFPADGSNPCTTGTALSGITTSSASPTALTLFSGAGDGNTGTALSPGGTRYFVLTFTSDDLTNASQNQQAKFDLTWHVDQ
jgi:hypothetical protein